MMELIQYLEESARTAKSDIEFEVDPDVLHGAIGLVTESGELLDMLKRHMFYGEPFDLDNLIEELGDIQWYHAMICRKLGIDPRSVLRANIEKLRKRYPKAYTNKLAKERLDKK